MRHLQVFSVVLVVWALAGAAFGQTATLSGTVADQTGAVIQGADVTVRSLATNATRSSMSGPTGAYAFTNLAPGVFELTVKKQNFKTFVVPDLALTVAQVATVDVQMQPGGASERVEVRADQLPNVELESAQLSNLVDQKKIQDLPLITRDPYSLVLLSPGTSQTNTGLGGFTVNGSRERNNNFLLDGVDNNDTSVPGGGGSIVLSANPDSTQEFRVITSNFNAEYGRNTGAIVDVVTKSGTNDFHGAAYWFGRYNGFGGARDWFNPAVDSGGSPQKMNPYVRNQFGYSIGGPIIKNKTFFFFNQEFQRFRTTLTGVSFAPTAAFRTGKFNYIDPVDGSTVPVDLTLAGANNRRGLPLDPTIQQIWSLYPVPSQSADGISGPIFYPSSSKQNSYQAVLKLDHRFTDKELLSVRYGYGHATDPNPFHDEALPGGIAATGSKSISQSGVASLTSTLRTNLLNNFSVGWNHIYANFRCGETSTLDQFNPLDAFGNGRDYLMSPFTTFGCISLVSNGQFRKTGTNSFSDNLSWVKGNHTLRFGFDFRNIHESGPNAFFSRRQVDVQARSTGGVRLVTGVTNLTFDLMNAAGALYGLVANDFGGEFFDKGGVRQGTDDKKFRQHEYDWFGQDTWKVTRNFTLTLGLRYQLDGVPYEENANFSNLLTAPDSFPVVLSVVGPGTGKQIYKTDYSNIEPRVGFSWDPKGDGKTAIRAAFGIFHDRVFGNLFGNARGNPPFEQDYNQFPFETINGACATTPACLAALQPGDFPVILPDTTPSANIPDQSFIAPVVFDTHFRNSVSNNWNFGIQRELWTNDTIDIAYVGSEGHHIYRQVDGNPPDPNLVSQLVAFCSDPANEFGCVPTDVSSTNLYAGAEFGVLPFNAVAHNALFQPFYQRSVGNAIYNALQAKWTHRLSHGVQIQGAYTWAHAIDDSADPLAPAQGNRTFPRNSRNLSQDRGNSDNDIRHVAVINYIWELPFGRGRAFASQGVIGRILEGIQFSGITTIQTGHPFEIRGRVDSQRTGINGWADLVGNPFTAGANTGTIGSKVWFSNPAAFANVPDAEFGRAGNIARNQFYGPGLVSVDVSLAKKMKITERVGMELRFEGYNIANHPHFQQPGNLVDSGTFGLITATAGRPDATTSARQVQAALKLTF